MRRILLGLAVFVTLQGCKPPPKPCDSTHQVVQGEYTFWIDPNEPEILRYTKPGMRHRGWIHIGYWNQDSGSPILCIQRTSGDLCTRIEIVKSLSRYCLRGCDETDFYVASGGCL